MLDAKLLKPLSCMKTATALRARYPRQSCFAASDLSSVHGVAPA